MWIEGRGSEGGLWEGLVIVGVDSVLIDYEPGLVASLVWFGLVWLRKQRTINLTTLSPDVG